MSDIKLFRLGNEAVEELHGKVVPLEKQLQALLEKHLETFLGARFLETEYRTGKTHGGRIDSLGIDENNCPVIIEYKRSSDENVISQGLYYLDWLLDHKAEFDALVVKKLGPDSDAAVDWSSPRLLCIAGDFSKYDEHAVQQIDRNIELIRYRRYDEGFLILELVNAVNASGSSSASTGAKPSSKTSTSYKTVTQYLEQSPQALKDLYLELEGFLLGLGDDVQVKVLTQYVAFSRLRNFACVEVYSTMGKLLVHAKVNPDSLVLEPGFTRDVRNIGHYGTGDLEITITSLEDLQKAGDILKTSYANS